MVSPVGEVRETQPVHTVSPTQTPAVTSGPGDSITLSQESWGAFFLSKLQSAWNYLLRLFYCCSPRGDNVRTEAPPYRQTRPTSAELPIEIRSLTEEALPESEPRELPSSPPASNQPSQPVPPPPHFRDTLRKIEAQAIASQYTDEAPPNNHLKMEGILTRAFQGCGDASPHVTVMQLKFPLIDMSQNHKLVFEVDKEKQQFSVKSEGSPYNPIEKKQINLKFIQRWNIAYAREENFNRVFFSKKGSI